MASQDVAAFVNKLSTDPGYRSQYKADPEGVMSKESSLSEQDKTVLRTNDADQIRTYMGDDAPPGCLVLIE